MTKKLIVLGLCGLMLSACSTVTVNPEGTQKRSKAPTWQETQHFGFWGLAGTGDVDTRAVCGDRKVTQMQAQSSFVDELASGVSYGLYDGWTVKIDCE